MPGINDDVVFTVRTCVVVACVVVVVVVVVVVTFIFGTTTTCGSPLPVRADQLWLDFV